MKKVKLQYRGTSRLKIPFLKSRGGIGINLPLMNYNLGKPLPVEQQIIEVSENEANDLMKQWPNDFSIKKEAKKTNIEEGGDK